jgi:hypothetical protein
MTAATPLLVLVAGPYRSGTGDDPDRIAANVRAMEQVALGLYRAGHLPVLGEWFALPLIARSGSRAMGDAAWDAVFHPVSERLARRCDACLRMGGPSAGADRMVAIFEELGRPVYRRIEEVPGWATTA